MNFSCILKVSLLWMALIFLGSFLLLERYEPVSTITLSDRPKNQNNLPIGEIKAGFKAEQFIHASSIFRRNKTSYDDDVCIELLLANWSNRTNSGKFAVELIITDETYTEVIEAASVKDNANHRVCFEDLQVKKLIENDELRLILRGISSPAGAAITAWTTTDLSSGRLANVPEQYASRSLVFHFVSKRYSEISYQHALILVFFGMVAIAIAIFPSTVGRRQISLHSTGNVK